MGIVWNGEIWAVKSWHGFLNTMAKIWYNISRSCHKTKPTHPILTGKLCAGNCTGTLRFRNFNNSNDHQGPLLFCKTGFTPCPRTCPQSLSSMESEVGQLKPLATRFGPEMPQRNLVQFCYAEIHHFFLIFFYQIGRFRKCQGP